MMFWPGKVVSIITYFTLPGELQSPINLSTFGQPIRSQATFIVVVVKVSAETPKN